MAGKTGTAQVRKISGAQRGQSGEWKYKDHGLFVFFAPADAPKYAGAVVIEHGMGGARAAAPVAKSLMTYMFNPEQAMAELTALETNWGGNVNSRMARKAAAWKSAGVQKSRADGATQGSVDDSEIRQSSEPDPQAMAPVNPEEIATPEPETASTPTAAPITTAPRSGDPL